MAIGPTDRARIRAYLGYPNVSSSFILQHGVAAGIIESNWLLEAAFERIRDEALPIVYACLDNLDVIERTKVEAIPRMAAVRLGNLTLRPSQAGLAEIDLLERAKMTWVRKLADQFGVAPNSLAMGQQSSGSVTRHVG